MNSGNAKRKLTAILYADAKEYSRLMGEDELRTIRTLHEYRDLMSALINRFEGRVVDSPGDNLLAEFASAVNAVACAVKIQNMLKTRNDTLPANRRLEFRVGINLGDVIDDGKNIYGDGVNVADRLESLAEGGGICISGTVYDHVENKLNLKFKNLGKRSVKNIRRPIRVYRVLTAPNTTKWQSGNMWAVQRNRIFAGVALVAVAIVGVAAWNFSKKSDFARKPVVLNERVEVPVSEKPSIAVVPFKNLSRDPSEDYFADGITADLITNLSKISGILVSTRNSSSAEGGKPTNIRDFTKRSNLQYLLEGSVRRAEEQFLIIAQLIDMETGNLLWSDRYDRHLKDLIIVLDEIIKSIFTVLQIEPTNEEQTRLQEKGTGYLEAFLQALKNDRQQKIPKKVKQKDEMKRISPAVASSDNKKTSKVNLEITFWESVKNSKSVKMFEAYLRKFPKGIFAELARINIAQISNTDSSQLKDAKKHKAEPQRKLKSSFKVSHREEPGKSEKSIKKTEGLVSQDPVKKNDLPVPSQKTKVKPSKPSYFSSLGSIEKDSAVAQKFKNYQYSPNYNYFYTGYVKSPEAIVGIRKGYDLVKAAGWANVTNWQSFEPSDSGIFSELVNGMGKGWSYYGAYIKVPSGEQIGIMYTNRWGSWYSPHIRLLENNRLEVVPHKYTSTFAPP